MPIPYASGEALTCGQIRELDVLTIEHVGIPGIVLMENAGRQIAEFVFGTLVDPERSRVVVLAGPGNNGGDGFVLARHLHNAGVAVRVVLAAGAEKSGGDAATNLKIVERMNLELIGAYDAGGIRAAKQAMDAADVIVDALLGTGSRGAPRAEMGELVQYANGLARPRRVAVDIPSGLDGDSGEVHEPCFRADATVTMLAPKTGFAKGQGPEVVGRVVTVDIGTPRELIPGRRSREPGT